MVDFQYVIPNPEVPDHYFCSKCKAKGCKLWRMGASSYIELKCFRCLVPNKDIKISADGKSECKYFIGVKTDQIEDHVPAVPVDDTYWGYTSVPENGVLWWRSLRSEP